MDGAVAEYARWRRSPEAWMLGRFVAPAARLAELGRAADAFLPEAGAGDPWPLSALLGADVRGEASLVASFNRSHAGRAAVDTVELKAASVAEVEAALEPLPPGLVAFVELPLGGDLDAVLAVVGARGARAKARTGGVVPEAVPGPRALARFLVACARAGVGFKATAGLHHPVRAERALTYEPDAPRATMHGFLNVFAAAALARAGPAARGRSRPARRGPLRLPLRGGRAPLARPLAVARRARGEPARLRPVVRLLLLRRAGADLATLGVLAPPGVPVPLGELRVIPRTDGTHDPALRSWVESANDPATDFPVQNLPLGVFRYRGEGPPASAARSARRSSTSPPAPSAGLLRGLPSEVEEACRAASLGGLMALEPRLRGTLRHRLSHLLRARAASSPRGARRRTCSCRARTRDAAAGRGRRLHRLLRLALPRHERRPDAPAGQPAPAELQVGPDRVPRPRVVAGGERHAGAPAARPDGAPARRAPAFGPSRGLDYELEVGAFLGPGNALGEPIPWPEAEAHLFGLVLVNDWSARDLQKWEYQPLGPFLAKSFATTISPWVVTLEALAPFRVAAFARPEGDPRPLPHLAHEDNEAHGGIDLRLEALSSPGRCARGACPVHGEPEQPARPVLDPRPDGRPPLLERLQPAPGGPRRERHGVRGGEGGAGLPPRADVARRRAPRVALGRGAAVPRGRDEVILRGRCEREGFAPSASGSAGASWRRPPLPRDSLTGSVSLEATMAKVESLGIRRLESVHYYVHDLERSRRFYTETMDFAEVGGSSEELTRAGRQRSVAFLAGNCVVVCIEPRGEGGRAWRWLRKHPDGVGTLNFEVEDVERTFRLLEGRGGTPIDDVRRFRDGDGELAFFSITTPFGDTTFRFLERRGYRALFPGFETARAPRGGGEPPRLRGLRPHDVELPHPRPRRPLARARDGLRAVLGDPVPHDRRGPRPPERLRAALARLPGPDVRGEVREQRAVAPQLPPVPDQRLQRGAAGAGRPAPRDHGQGHRRLREGAARAGARVHAHPRHLLRRCRSG
jgi:fumarylacetoacetase